MYMEPPACFCLCLLVNIERVTCHVHITQLFNPSDENAHQTDAIPKGLGLVVAGFCEYGEEIRILDGFWEGFFWFRYISGFKP